MKIINQPDPTWNYKFSCTKCKSQLEADASDLKYQYYAGDQREPTFETYSLQCPVCSHIFPVNPCDIPNIVRINIQKKTWAVKYLDVC